MNTWTNATTGYNRAISTGPTPDGKLDDFVITIGYVVENGKPQQSDSFMALNLDQHIIPLLIRLPEMYDTLHEVLWHLKKLDDSEIHGPIHSYELRKIIARCKKLIDPTPQEVNTIIGR